MPVQTWNFASLIISTQLLVAINIISCPIGILPVFIVVYTFSFTPHFFLSNRFAILGAWLNSTYGRPWAIRKHSLLVMSLWPKQLISTFCAALLSGVSSSTFLAIAFFSLVKKSDVSSGFNTDFSMYWTSFSYVCTVFWSTFAPQSMRSSAIWLFTSGWFHNISSVVSIIFVTSISSCFLYDAPNFNGSANVSMFSLTSGSIPSSSWVSLLKLSFLFSLLNLLWFYMSL